MTINEKSSLRKKKSLLFLVERGEYSAGYALLKTEDLHDNGKLTDADYDELADYLESLLNEVEPVEKTVELVENNTENVTEVAENIADVAENIAEESVEENDGSKKEE